MATALALTLLVAACSSRDAVTPQVRLVEIPSEVPAEAKRRCDAPVIVPVRDYRQREIVSLWNRDRAALRVCERRRALAVGEVK